MAKPKTLQVSKRKEPSQARSTALVTAILQAAVQVLEQEGMQRFTTARVAERAGVSVGSLYQYFPNKASLLFELQTSEWRETHTLLQTILSDRKAAPLARLRHLVHAFVQSECDEAAIRTALSDAAPLYRDTPEADAAREASTSVLSEFLKEALPTVQEETRALARTIISTTLGSAGKSFSEADRTAAEITRFSDGLSDMFCAYLQGLNERA